MKTFLLAAFFLPGAVAMACESLLTASAQRKSGFQFTPARYLEANENLHELLEENMFFILRDPGGEIWTMAFDPSPHNFNRAYRFSLKELKKNSFKITRFERAAPHEEREYFRRVAEMHKIRDTVVNLSDVVLNCQKIILNSSIVAKLWLKHHLNPQDVRYVLNHEHSEPEPETINRRSGDRRFKIHGVDGQGRKVMIVLADRGYCPAPLVTAFEEGN